MFVLPPLRPNPSPYGGSRGSSSSFLGTFWASHSSCRKPHISVSLPRSASSFSGPKMCLEIVREEGDLHHRVDNKMCTYYNTATSAFGPEIWERGINNGMLAPPRNEWTSMEKETEPPLNAPHNQGSYSSVPNFTTT